MWVFKWIDNLIDKTCNSENSGSTCHSKSSTISNLNFLTKYINGKKNNLYCMLLDRYYSPEENSEGSVEYAKKYKAKGSFTGKKIHNVSSYIKNKTVYITGNPVVWWNTTIEARYAIVYSNNEIICTIDFGQNMSCIKGNFHIEFNDGILSISY